GYLHFGSLVAAVASYLDARAVGGKWLVRMEDLDPPREMPGAQAAILEALERYGFEWDGPVEHQRERGDAYAAQVEQ
ncbi:glutamate--tRNA ligase family protein, partial [Pseudomonas sp. BAgro211]|nr:glutamate--tRNA ligase family protein [Pseudomonas sp. BAgro211]